MGLPDKWKKEKAQRFRRKLLLWYRNNCRELPWRKNPTPYRVWVSEIMLQQTQAATVIPYYARFLDRFPDIESLAKASEHEILELWAGLGYYSRAKNLHRAARLILARHGAFPRDLESIRALPGIGRYTAGAICSIAFNQPQPIVDGNVRRVISRLTGTKEVMPESFFWRLMTDWMSPQSPSDFNQAMMELGALVCVPSEPHCAECPARRQCKAFALGIQNQIPPPRVKRSVQSVDVAVLILEEKQRLLLTSHRRFPIIPGSWGFPCRRVLSGETPEQAASALCREIFGRIVPLTGRGKIRHSISNYRITAHGFIRTEGRKIRGFQWKKDFRWVPIPQSGAMLTSSLFRKVLRLCVRGL